MDAMLVTASAEKLRIYPNQNKRVKTSNKTIEHHGQLRCRFKRTKRLQEQQNSERLPKSSLFGDGIGAVLLTAIENKTFED